MAIARRGCREKEFFNLASLQCCVGADGSHINIRASEENQVLFLDKIMKHIINLMAVCTADKNFHLYSLFSSPQNCGIQKKQIQDYVSLHKVTT